MRYGQLQSPPPTCATGSRPSSVLRPLSSLSFVNRGRVGHTYPILIACVISTARPHDQTKDGRTEPPTSSLISESVRTWVLGRRIAACQGPGRARTPPANSWWTSTMDAVTCRSSRSNTRRSLAAIMRAHSGATNLRRPNHIPDLDLPRRPACLFCCQSDSIASFFDRRNHRTESPQNSLGHYAYAELTEKSVSVVAWSSGARASGRTGRWGCPS